MMKNISLKCLTVLHFFLLLLIISCKGEKCESFNLKRIPFNLKYFEEPLQYSNGVDTITLYGVVSQISKETRLSGYANPTCDPHLSIDYEGKPYTIGISFHFEYSPENDYTALSVWINSSNVRNIKIDSDFLASLKRQEEIVYQKMDNNNKDSSRMLRKFSLQNMRVTYFEFLDGKKWQLIR